MNQPIFKNSKCLSNKAPFTYKAPLGVWPLSSRVQWKDAKSDLSLGFVVLRFGWVFLCWGFGRWHFDIVLSQSVSWLSFQLFLHNVFLWKYIHCNSKLVAVGFSLSQGYNLGKYRNVSVISCSYMLHFIRHPHLSGRCLNKWWITRNSLAFRYL